MSKLIPEDDLKRALSYPECRKVIRAMLGHLGLFRQPYIAGDPETTAFNCGSLNYALAFFDECFSAAPEMTAIMLREMKNDGPNAKQQPARADERLTGTGIDSRLGEGSGNDGNPFIE